MSTQPKSLTDFHYHKFDEKDMPLVKEYAAEMKAYSERFRALQKQLESEAQTLTEAHRLVMKRKWAGLMAAVDLDSEQTWSAAEYAIELRFVDDGFAAVVFMPTPQSMMAAQAEAEAKEDAVADGDTPPMDPDVPEGTVLN